MEHLYKKLDLETHQIMAAFAKRLFQKKDMNIPEIHFEKFFKKYSVIFLNALVELLNLWDTKEHRETLGHDKIHITYDMLEFLYLINNVPLTKQEQYLILFGSLLHDLGRYPELLLKKRSGAIEFDKENQIQFHAALSGYLAVLLAKKYKVQNEKDPIICKASKAFNRRVVGAVLLHGSKNELRDPIAHHVQSLDRLAGILGSRQFVRNVITDGVQRGALVYPDERLDYSYDLPGFNNLPVENFQESKIPRNSWTNILHYIEMPMRNLFPLSTKYGMERAKVMRRESGIILTLLSGGKTTDLYRQVFAPELNQGQEYNFPKTRLPGNLWESIKQGIDKEETQTMSQYQFLDITTLINILLDQQAPDIPITERVKVQKLLINVPKEHRKDIHNTLVYVIARRKLNKTTEREFLIKIQQCPDPLINYLIGRIIQSTLF